MQNRYIGIDFSGITTIIITASTGLMAYFSVSTHQAIAIQTFCLILFTLLLIGGIGYGFCFPTISETALLISWPLIPFINKRFLLSDIERIVLFAAKAAGVHYTISIILTNGKRYRINDLYLFPYKKIGLFIDNLEKLGVKVDNQYYYKS